MEHRPDDSEKRETGKKEKVFSDRNVTQNKNSMSFSHLPPFPFFRSLKSTSDG